MQADEYTGTFVWPEAQATIDALMRRNAVLYRIHHRAAKRAMRPTFEAAVGRPLTDAEYDALFEELTRQVRAAALAAFVDGAQPK